MSFFHRKRDKPAKASAKPGDSLGHITIQSSESFAPSRTRSPSPSRSPSSLPSGAPTVPAPTQHRDLWKEAFDSLDESQRNSLEDESTRSKKSSLDIVDSVIDLTENEYKDYCTRGWHISKGDKTRETNVRIQAKVILCSALQFKDVIEAGLKFDPSGYGTIAWGVISAVFRSAAEMARILPKYAVVESQYRDQPLQEQAAFEDRLIAVYTALLQYASEAKKGLYKSIPGKIFSSFWAIESQAITALQADLIRTDEAASDMLHLVAHQQRKIEFSKLVEKASQSLDRLDRVVEKLLDMERIRSLSWLSSAKPSDRQHSLRVKIERDNPKSGKWFLTSREFSSWQKCPGSFLWLNGVSGCGKSSLCSTIINSLIQSAAPQGPILAYWYFDNGNPKTQDLRALLRYLLRQVAASADVFPKDVRNLVSKHEGAGSEPSLGELQLTLQQTVSGLKREILIVMDAIDEYPADRTVDRRHDLLTLITNLVKEKLGNLHILVTSIDERDIHDAFHSMESPPVEQDVEPLLLDDVSSFVEATVHRYSLLKSWWTSDIKDKIIGSLKADDSRRFRIVALQLEDINKCYDETEIDEVLTSLSPTIESLYERRLANVSQKNIDRLRHLFYWISLAARRLRPWELAAAPGVDLRSPDDIFTICPRGLVTKEEKRHKTRIIVTDPEGGEESGQSASENDDSTGPSSPTVEEYVVFAHPSVKRFLMSEKLRDSKGLPSKFFIAEKEAHVELAELVLQYLLTLESTNPSIAFLESRPFMSYATTSLIPHLQMMNTCQTDDWIPIPLLLKFFGSPIRPAYIYWLNTADPLGIGLHFNPANFPSPLYAAIQLDLQVVIDHLLETGAFLDFPASSGYSPLHFAVVRKDYDTASKLIKKGADLSQVNKDGISPLYLAVGTGATALVQELLTAGARINNREGECGNALQYACFLGHFDIVKVLLKHNADVTAEGGRFGMALQAASAIGHEEIVEALLNAKANPNFQGGILGNSIQAALTGGHTRVVERLIASGAAFDAQTNLIWTEAFDKYSAEEPENYGRNRSWQLSEYEIDLGYWSTESQKLLAASFAVFNNLSSEEQKISSRFPSENRRRSRLSETRDDDKKTVAKLCEYIHKAGKIGLEGQNTAGFFAKTVFHAWTIRCLAHTVPSERDKSSSCFLQAFQIVDSRNADQIVIENDTSGIYAAARMELVALYKIAFVLISTYGPLIWKLRRWLRPTIKLPPEKEIENTLQLLITQNRRFSLAMLTANASREASETTRLNTRILSQLETEIQRSNYQIGEYVQKAIQGMEERILNVIREELPQMIRDEFRKALQEYGMPKS